MGDYIIFFYGTFVLGLILEALVRDLQENLGGVQESSDHMDYLM